MLGAALAIGGAALGLPSIIKQTQEISDRSFGTDWTGSKRRANMLADAQWRALMGDEVEAQDQLASETILNQLLSPWGATEPWDGLAGVHGFMDASNLNDAVNRHQQDLGRLSQVYQDDSFEALAMQMGL